jgi:hypothetical protein
MSVGLVLVSALLLSGWPVPSARAQASEREPFLAVAPASALPGAPISVSGACPLPGRVVVEVDGHHLDSQPVLADNDGAWLILTVDLPRLEPGPADVVGRCFDLAGAETFWATETIEVLDPQAYLDELDEGRRSWARHEPPAYVYTWYEGGFWGPPFAFRTTVVDGVVTGVVPDLPEGTTPELEAEVLAEWHEEMDGAPLPERTIEDHFDRIDALVADPPAQLSVTYDDWFGYPVEIETDENWLLADDEITTTITDVVEITLPIPPSPSPTPVPAPVPTPAPATPGFTG